VDSTAPYNCSLTLCRVHELNLLWIRLRTSGSLEVRVVRVDLGGEYYYVIVDLGLDGVRVSGRN